MTKIGIIICRICCGNKRSQWGVGCMDHQSSAGQVPATPADVGNFRDCPSEGADSSP